MKRWPAIGVLCREISTLKPDNDWLSVEKKMDLYIFFSQGKNPQRRSLDTYEAFKLI